MPLRGKVELEVRSGNIIFTVCFAISCIVSISYNEKGFVHSLDKSGKIMKREGGAGRGGGRKKDGRQALYNLPSHGECRHLTLRKTRRRSPLSWT